MAKHLQKILTERLSPTIGMLANVAVFVTSASIVSSIQPGFCKNKLQNPQEFDSLSDMVSTRADKNSCDPRVIHIASIKNYYKAREVMEAGDFKSAIPLYTQYIKQYQSESKPNKKEWKIEHDYYLAWGYQNRGFCELALGEYEEGIADCTTAIKLRPAYPETYKNRARAYRLTGKIQLAEQDEQQVRRLTKLNEAKPYPFRDASTFMNHAR